jgi:thiosulfate/3-mercaptopyruvate sulfurtransferase
MSYETLISVETLSELSNVKILDCRAVLGDPELGRQRYAQGHIPGAGYLSLDHDLAAAPGAGGRHPLPEPEQLARRLRELGINNDDQVVVYDDAGGAIAARAWWCLRWLGHAAVAVLDGGLKAWQGELSTEVPAVTAGNFSVRPSLTRAINVNELSRTLQNRTLIDARSEARFAGREEPIDPVAGHIPGAVCMPFQLNLDPSGHFRSAAELRERFAGLAPDADTVCYCGSGVTAAHNILAMKVAGYAEPVLYPGSWSEWIVSPQREIATDDQA